MRLLLVAPGASADAVGETRMAYEWISRLSERHDVTLLAHHRRGHPLTAQFPRARVVEWPELALFQHFERFNAMAKPGYLPFLAQARRWIRASLAAGERFDVGHQLVPVSLRYPSPLAGTGVPYVVGPVGGSLASPPSFAAEEGGSGWFTALRRLDGLRLRHDPALRHSFSEAGCVLGIADYVEEMLADVPLRAFRVLGDVGIDALPPAASPTVRVRDVRFLFVGRVVRTKGVRDAVRALARLPRGTARLDVVGVGYDLARCRLLAAELGVGDLVTFHGWLAHEEVMELYPRADVFLFPSYREAGGIAVVEALAHGLPAIVCDRGGPARTVDGLSALRVAAHDPDQYAADLATAMERLAADPALRARMGRAARRRVESVWLWERRVEWIERLYEEVACRAGGAAGNRAAKRRDADGGGGILPPPPPAGASVHRRVIAPTPRGRHRR